MSDKVSSRLDSAKAIDELLSLTERRQPPNWLLTYIDVFVLIVMLVVTLVALSSFEPTSPAERTPAVKHAGSLPAKPVEKSEVKVVETTSPEPAPKEPTKEPVLVAEEVSAIKTMVEQMLPAETAKPTEPAEPTNPAEERIEETEETQQTETAIQQQLTEQLAQLGLSDSINMTVTQGYAQLEIQDNILYQSSEATLTESGQAVLTKLTPLLKQAKGLIYIEGHTDNRPIKTTQFPSNWELGAGRATSVLHFLASQQIDASRLRAVTYAETKPIANNDSEEGRQKNRRVNIVIKVSDKVD